MRLPLFQADAFTNRLFGGNPAAVVPLETWLPDATLQAIAQENNLAETAYIVRTGETWHLRWFTPMQEIDLCGHATLAAAFVMSEYLGIAESTILFDTLSGRLTVTREGNVYWLDFPARPGKPVAVPELVAAVGGSPVETLAARDHMLVYRTEEEVAALAPDFHALRKLDHFAAIATAPGKTCDFVSRFFAPRAGIDEDPVTGSAHCTLTPYWAEKLGKTRLAARQISPRVGNLDCILAGDRVRMGGQGVLYLKGEIYLP